MQKVGQEEMDKLNKNNKIQYENFVGRVKSDINEAVIGKKKCCCCFCCCEEYTGVPDFNVLQGGHENLKNVYNDPKIATAKFKILYNPSSGGGNCLKFVEKIKQQLEIQKQKDRVEFLESQSLEHFKQVVSDYDYDKADNILVICGGDGSLSYAINFLYAKQNEENAKTQNQNNQISNDKEKIKPIKIGILPGGTANDLCCCLNVDPEFYNIEKLLKTPIMRKIDVLKMTYFDENDVKQERLIIDNIGIGFTGRVVELANNSCFYKMFFRSKYKIAAQREALKNIKDIVTIEDENKQIIIDKVGVQFLTFNNVQTIGKVYRTTPYAQIDDGLVDLAFCSCPSFGSLIEVLQATEKNGMSLYSPYTSYYKGRKFKIIFEENTKMLASPDGELIYCQKYMEIEAVSNYLNIIY